MTLPLDRVPTYTRNVIYDLLLYLQYGKERNHRTQLLKRKKKKKNVLYAVKKYLLNVPF